MNPALRERSPQPEDQQSKPGKSGQKDHKLHQKDQGILPGAPLAGWFTRHSAQLRKEKRGHRIYHESLRDAFGAAIA